MNEFLWLILGLAASGAGYMLAFALGRERQADAAAAAASQASAAYQEGINAGRRMEQADSTRCARCLAIMDERNRKHRDIGGGGG